MISLYFEGALLGLLVAISLGPAFFAIIQTSINKGFKHGIFMAIGISLSDMMLVTISYLIGASLFDDPQNKVYVGLIGGIILIIFGSVSWAKKPEILKRRSINYQAPTGKPLFLYTIRGFFLNIANPFLFFFWFGALGFVGKNAIEGEMLESTIIFFAGTFSVVFATDILKSYIGGKIKGFLRPRKEILLNKAVGIALVIFGVVLIFRTLDGIGFFERVQFNSPQAAEIEATYDIKTQSNVLNITLYKDSTFSSTVQIKDSLFYIDGNWHYVDTTNNIFELDMLTSNIDTMHLPQKRLYKQGITGITPYSDTTILSVSPDDFEVTQNYILSKIKKASIIIPNTHNNIQECKDWSLNEQQIRKIVQNAKQIDGKELNNQFETLPCVMNVQINQGNFIFQLQLNAASWFSITVNDSSIYYGSFIKQNEGLFLTISKKEEE